MKAPFPFAQNTAKRSAKSSLLWIASLVICALFTHSFDACAAHWGSFASTSGTQLVLAHQHINPSRCEICTSRSDASRDACEIVSEVAVRSAAQHNLDIHTIIVVSNVAVILAVPHPLSSVNSRYIPVVSSPIVAQSPYLRAVLPARAPPFFA